MPYRLPAILIVLTAALAVVFLSVAAHLFIPRPSFVPLFAPSETARSGTLTRLSEGNGRVPLRVDSAEAIDDGVNSTDGDAPPGRLYGAGALLASPAPPLRLLFFGDLMLDRHVGEKIAAKGLGHLLAGLSDGNGRDPLRVVSAGAEDNLLSTGTRPFNIVAANLEGAVTDKGAHYPPVNAYDFAFAPGLIEELKNYGFNFFNLANNHILDQGERGWRETLANLDALDIAYSGCPDRQTGACSTRTMEADGRTVALLGFSQVYGLLDREDVIKQVASSSESADLTVVNIHWGSEYEHRYSPGQQSLAHGLVEAGADLVIGHHPHVVQGLEIYKDRPIFYSLGNFIFDQYFSPATQEGLAVEAVVGGDGMELVLHPLQSKGSAVNKMMGEEREGFLKRFVGWSSFNDQVSMINGQLMINF